MLLSNRMLTSQSAIVINTTIVETNFAILVQNVVFAMALTPVFLLGATGYIGGEDVSFTALRAFP